MVFRCGIFFEWCRVFSLMCLLYFENDMVMIWFISLGLKQTKNGQGGRRLRPRGPD